MLLLPTHTSPPDYKNAELAHKKTLFTLTLNSPNFACFIAIFFIANKKSPTFRGGSYTMLILIL